MVQQIVAEEGDAQQGDTVLVLKTDLERVIKSNKTNGKNNTFSMKRKRWKWNKSQSFYASKPCKPATS